MQEWFIWHAWKACIRLKWIEGSNPSLSAKKKTTPTIGGVPVRRCGITRAEGFQLCSNGGPVANLRYEGCVVFFFDAPPNRITAGNP